MLKKTLLLISTTIISRTALAQTQSQLFEPLRTATNIAQQFDFYTKFVVLFIAIILSIIAFLAWRKKKESKRFLLLAIAFGLFAGKWLLKVLDLFFSPGQFFADAASNVFELLILGSLFGALFFKGKK